MDDSDYIIYIASKQSCLTVIESTTNSDHKQQTDTLSKCNRRHLNNLSWELMNDDGQRRMIGHLGRYALIAEQIYSSFQVLIERRNYS